MDAIIPEDYFDIKRVTSVDQSGNLVVWDEKQPDKIENSYSAKLKILFRDSGEIRQFTSGSKVDSQPQFSPNGDKLAFLSTRSDKPQIFIMHVDGGEAVQLTKAKYGVTGFNFSPDGSKITFTAMIDPNEPEDEEPPETKFEAEQRKAEQDEKERKIKDPRVITDLVYRQGTSYNHPDRFSHVYVIDLETNESKRISDGYYHHSIPSFISETEVLTTSKRDIPRDLSTKVQLIKFNINSTSEGEILTEYDAYWPAPPIVKNDLIFVNVMGDGTFAGQHSKWALFKDGELEIINLELDRGVPFLKITDTGRVYAAVEDTGKVDVREYNINNNKFEKLFDTDESVIDFTVVDDNEVYFTATSALHVWALWKWTQENGVELVDDPNADGISSKQLVDPEEMWFTNPEGIKYQGWFFDASEYSDEEKPPLVLSIHGGPHAMWTNGGTMMHEWQTTVNAGYSVLALNPIGSQGYGEDFSQIIIPAKWGHDDARDLLTAVDTIVDRVNADRLYITGGSYAGFQTANIISRDNRFKAAVAQRGVYNFVNFGLVTDIPLWFGWEMGGTPYEKLQELWDNSPLGRAKNIETPLLIIHAENDFRVPISEAESLFTSLKLQDKEVVFVRYPRDGHELSRSGEPLHVVDRIERMIDWFDSHP